MKNKLSALIFSLLSSVILLILSVINCFAFGENTNINTGDNTTTIAIILAVIMLAALIAIIFLSIKKKK